MTGRKHIALSIGVSIGLGLLQILLTGCGGQSRYCRFDGFAQGGTWHVICELPGRNPRKIREIQSGIDSLLAEIDASISGYNRGSLLSRFNAGEEILPDGHFRTLFELSKALADSTEGAFDPSAAPLFDLWNFGFSQTCGNAQPCGNGSTGATIPTRQAIDSVLTFTGMRHFTLKEDGRITRDDPRSRLNFNAIAQGYSCDVIAAFLSAQGCRNFLVEVGGEIACRGTRPGGELWNIVCDAPQAADDTLHLTNCAVVTSGNYRKHGEAGGKQYGHIIDPRTGWPTADVTASRTIIVRNEDSAWPCATADALATAAMLR